MLFIKALPAISHKASHSSIVSFPIPSLPSCQIATKPITTVLSKTWSLSRRLNNFSSLPLATLVATALTHEISESEYLNSPLVVEPSTGAPFTYLIAGVRLRRAVLGEGCLKAPHDSNRSWGAFALDQLPISQYVAFHQELSMLVQWS
jgi:hypothetical protein